MPETVYVYSYNGEIVDIFGGLKGAYNTLKSGLQENDKLTLKSYSQLTRDMKISPLFNFIPKPLKVHQIRCYEVIKKFQ